MHLQKIAVIAALATLTLTQADPAAAGCGCDKPPPALASVRPAFASPGDTVSLFADRLVAGETYVVKFESGRGSQEHEVTLAGRATLRRDFADGIVKPQIVMPAPDLPPGPTRIVVEERHGHHHKLLQIRSDDFTLLQAPLTLTETNSTVAALCYRAAVGADGTVYLPFDISDIKQRMIFNGLALSYPLLFDADDITIYNTQGVLMQLLTPANAAIFDITDPGSPNSFILTYNRHEFLTYEGQHRPGQVHAIDPTDPEWHADGTRHIDHHHLVLAIAGLLENGTVPVPGATPPFTFGVMTTIDPAAAIVGPPSSTTIMWGPCV